MNKTQQITGASVVGGNCTCDIQVKLDELSKTSTNPQWINSRNLWIKALAPGVIGSIGERLALSVLGGELALNNRSGYDIKLGEMLIEVKLSTLVTMNNRPILIWKQIRPIDPYTHICFIAVYPDTVRMFLVPRKDIPSNVLKHQHGRDKSLDIFQIHTRKVRELFPWMVSYEVAANIARRKTGNDNNGDELIS